MRLTIKELRKPTTYKRPLIEYEREFKEHKTTTGKWRCGFCHLYHIGQPNGKHQPETETSS